MSVCIVNTCQEGLQLHVTHVLRQVASCCKTVPLSDRLCLRPVGSPLPAVPLQNRFSTYVCTKGCLSGWMVSIRAPFCVSIFSPDEKPSRTGASRAARGLWERKRGPVCTPRSSTVSEGEAGDSSHAGDVEVSAGPFRFVLTLVENRKHRFAWIVLSTRCVC